MDGFTFNVKIVSPRTTGSWDASQYLVAGPSYTGEIPNQFDKDHVIRSSSRFMLALGRTAVYGPDDIDNVKKIQAGYLISPLQLSDGAGAQVESKESSDILPLFPFINTQELASNDPEPELFFTYANFISKYMEIPSYEEELFQKFSQLGISPGSCFNGQYMSIRDYAAISAGIKAGSQKIDRAPLLEKFGNVKDGWSGAISPPIFGPEDVMKGRYLTRAYAARKGLYGLDPQEAFYVSAITDVDGEVLNSTLANYTVTFPKGSLPPIKDGGFWSVTMYRMPQLLLVHNVDDRYSIGNRTPGLIYKSDGSLTIYLQKDKPSTQEGVANWLPAPDPVYAGYDTGLFRLTARIYWPTAEALAEPYFPPGVEKQQNSKSNL